jgi:DNA repair photolyase
MEEQYVPLPPRPSQSPRGRGSATRPDSRFLAWQREDIDDGWPQDEAAPAPRTQLLTDTARSVITYNSSPDVPFDRSINPYRGCEHGCVYCFARPSHAWLGLSPGLDFETRLFCKPNAAERLEEELAHPGYRPAPIALGVNTDAWQPVERQLGLTRQILSVLARCRHPLSAVTKSALIERDVDLLAEMAGQHLASVMVSVTTLQPELARRLEPRAASPARRIETIRCLAAAGVPVGVMFAPLIPALNDHELEAVLAAARAAGASTGGMVLLRLPHEVKDLFTDWLARHAPERASHVMSLLAQMCGGRANDPRFGSRMRGEGALAALHAQRLERACRKLGLTRRHPPLNCDLFAPPPRPGQQGNLFADA